MKALFQLLKNLFSKEPFEQEIKFTFSVYDLLFVVFVVAVALWFIFR